MPTFYTEELDIYADEFLSACNDHDKEEIIDILIEEEYLKKDCRLNQQSKKYNYSISEANFEESLDKLRGRWNMLTSEEEQLIIKLASRF
jgi:hypothetical protein